MRIDEYGRASTYLSMLDFRADVLQVRFDYYDI
jgi:hypothetical protein